MRPQGRFRNPSPTFAGRHQTSHPGHMLTGNSYYYTRASPNLCSQGCIGTVPDPCATTAMTVQSANARATVLRRLFDYDIQKAKSPASIPEVFPLTPNGHTGGGPGHDKRRPELGKWLLHQLFASEPGLVRFLPETRRYSPAVLRDMLERRKSVYLKPVAGARGRLVTRVWKEGGIYRLQTENRFPAKYEDLPALLAKMETLVARRVWIVQQDVGLKRIGGRPFDVRVMLQKTPGGGWECTGMCAKVAGPHSAVTNYARSRGTVMTVPEALSAAGPCPTMFRERVGSELRELGLRVARRLDTYQAYVEVGVDAGIDEDWRVWLLEANTGPSHALFRHLKDQTAYRRIRRAASERRAAQRYRPKRGALRQI
jgi:hypothetical protein